MENYINIYTGSTILTNRLAFLLDEMSISSIIKNHKESGRLAGFGTSENAVELFILSTDIEKATVLIEKFKKEIS